MVSDSHVDSTCSLEKAEIVIMYVSECCSAGARFDRSNMKGDGGKLTCMLTHVVYLVWHVARFERGVRSDPKCAWPEHSCGVGSTYTMCM